MSHRRRTGRLISGYVGLALVAIGCSRATAQNALSDFGECVGYYSNLRLPGGFLAYPGNTAITMCLSKLRPLLQAPQGPPQMLRFSRPGTSQQQFMADRLQCYQLAGGNCGAWLVCLDERGYHEDADGMLSAPPNAAITCTP
jgi:hypothetical protein